MVPSRHVSNIQIVHYPKFRTLILDFEGKKGYHPPPPPNVDSLSMVVFKASLLKYLLVAKWPNRNLSLRVCLVGVKTEMMENRKRKIWWKMSFSLFGWEKEKKKKERQKIWEKVFPLDPLFLSPQFERKMRWKKCLEIHFTQILSHLPLTLLITW